MSEQLPSDQSAPVSDTPKTDAVTRSAQYWPINAHVVPVHFARAQERRIAELELNLSSTAADLAQAQADGRALQANIRAIIDGVEGRCLAADGPVTNTRHEMTDDELRRIYVLAGGQIHD